MRLEHDMLGERLLPDDAWYGIHTLRAVENFPVSGKPIHRELVRALVEVKKAAAITNHGIGLLSAEKAEAILAACEAILSGLYTDQFLVDAMQGGAGTSANMNVNEVIANLALLHMGKEKGNYDSLDPLQDVNLSQSTNDVFPTAVRVAAIRLLLPLSEAFAALQTVLQEKEEEFSDVLKVGRTQLQDAVPVLLGQEFGAMAQAVARDRWRLYKVEERLRHINLGGTAIGTGLNAEKKYVFRVVETLRDITGLGLARSDTMIDLTQNCDVFVEVAGLVKTAAVNLSKIANDLRLMASGPRAGLGEIKLPALQAGSSMMPGKVNPVIPEMVNQVAFQVYGLDLAITMAAQSGQLELNAFLPLIANNLFDMLTQMTAAVRLLTDKCIRGIQADRERCSTLLENSWALVTALVGRIGYDRAGLIVSRCRESGLSVRQVLMEQIASGELQDENGEPISEVHLKQILNPIEMTKPGIPGKRFAVVRRDKLAKEAEQNTAIKEDP